MILALLPLATIATAPASAASQAPDFLDDLIAINIILFILSVIVEKITNLIRQYAPFRLGKALTNKKFGVWQNIGKKSPKADVPLKKIIEREVQSLSFMVGLGIAIAFRVDLFAMISSPNARDELFWSCAKWHSYEGFFGVLLLVISLGLSGFFLTFGSKFFHDLLDILFEVKNAKKKLADPTTFQQDNIKSFDDFLKTSYSSMIDTAIAQNLQLLSSPDRVGSPSHGQMFSDGQWRDCIDVHISTANTGQIPQSVTAKLDSGQMIKVPVNIVTMLGVALPLVGQGNTVDATASPTFKGTICCQVQDNAGTKQLLTCSHVVFNGAGKNSFGAINPPLAGDVGGIPGFQFTWAKCDMNYDIALLGPPGGVFSYIIPPGTPRKLSALDLNKNVSIVRQGGTITTGKIVNYCVTDMVPIKYSDGTFGVANLIVLANVSVIGGVTTYTPVTVAGDSGSCVYDDANNPIGMIIAGDLKFSYALSLVTVLTELKSTLV
jgi:hypothetical protein